MGARVAMRSQGFRDSKLRKGLSSREEKPKLEWVASARPRLKINSTSSRLIASAYPTLMMIHNLKNKKVMLRRSSVGLVDAISVEVVADAIFWTLNS